MFMKQLFFVLEYNLAPLQLILRQFGHSAFLTYDKEFGVPMNAGDMVIIAKAFQQKEEKRRYWIR